MTLRDILRHGTDEHHRCIDRSMGRFDVSNVNDYGNLLTVHAMVFPAIERWLERHGVNVDLPDWAERRRSRALIEDLEQLGRRAPAPLSCNFDATEPGRAGVLYVVEGSRLGATFLIRRLKASDSDLPCRFLSHGHGKSLWPGFVDWLNRRPFSSSEAEAALGAARGVFALYGQAMEGQRGV